MQRLTLEINLSFFICALTLHEQKKFKFLSKSDKSFKGEIKRIFHHF